MVINSDNGNNKIKKNNNKFIANKKKFSKLT